MASLSQFGHEHAVNRLLSLGKRRTSFLCVGAEAAEATIVVVHAKVRKRKSRGRWADRISGARIAVGLRSPMFGPPRTRFDGSRLGWVCRERGRRRDGDQVAVGDQTRCCRR